MSRHEMIPLFLHWFWAAFFLLFGTYLVVKPCCLTAVPAMFKRIRIADCAAADRIAAAAARREQLEAIPSTLGRYSGVISVILGVVAALTWVQPALLYGVLCLLLASISAAAYLHLRNSQPKRVALLAPRTIHTVVPSYWFALAVLDGVVLLTCLTRADLRLSAVFVCASTLVTIAIAWRLTQLPALLVGTDLPAEQIVDNRLRFSRSSAALNLAVVQPFVFLSQLLTYTSSEQAAFIFSSGLWIVFTVWVLFKNFEPMSLASA